MAKLVFAQLLLTTFAAATTAFVPLGFQQKSHAIRNFLPVADDGYIHTTFLNSPKKTNKTTLKMTEVSRNDITKAGAAALLAGILWCGSFVNIGPGEVGVQTTFGKVETLSPGPHLMFPAVSSVNIFSTKTQKLEQDNSVPTKEGLTVELDTALLYRVEPSKVTEIFKTIGKNYERTIIEPEVSSVVRGLTSEVEAKALYTSGRSEIQSKIKDELDAALIPRGIIVEDVLLKAVELPQQLTDSIEQKASAEQESARMEFILTKERQEAERKAIEAQGIADFQSIVSKGIDKNLLQWKGIEATEKLAESPNAKIVIMGNQKGSLPVILNGEGKE